MIIVSAYVLNYKIQIITKSPCGYNQKKHDNEKYTFSTGIRANGE